MDSFVLVILGFAAYGFLCLLISLKRLLFGNPKKKALENERIAAAERESRLRDDIAKAGMYIKELEEEITKLRAASAPLPDLFHGGSLFADHRDVTVYVPKENYEKMVLGNPLFVSRSQYNQYDKDAISLNYRGEELALLCRGKMQQLALDYLSHGHSGYAIISSIDNETKTVKVHLGFYCNCDSSYAYNENDDDDWDDEELEDEE